MRRALQKLSPPNAARLLAAFIVLTFVVLPRAEAASPMIGAGMGGSTAAPTGDFQNDSSATGVGGNDSFAYAVPRNAPADAEVVLPQPLLPSTAAQVKRILALQSQGDFAGADELTGRLDDNTLLGPILAARYLSPDYRSTAAELLSWYEQYNNQPEAAGIYRLLLRKQPRDAAPMPPQDIALPEATFTGPLSRPSGAPDSALWRRNFLAGVRDWRAGDIATAGPVFVRAAEMRGLSNDERSAAAFWAARASLRLQLPGDYLDWLHEAASAPASFYGILAGRLLGQGFGPTGVAATLTEADVTAVDATPNGHLAFALLQVGQNDQAEAALRALWPDMQNSPGLAHAVMAVAARAGLVDVAIAVAAQMPQSNQMVGDEFAGMPLPMPALHPAGGFTIDPPLVYALTRTESGFNPAAASPSGAEGLMQLMPQTAGAMRRVAGIAGALGNPSANLALGQAYVRYLGGQSGISDNLLAILASYNAGPGAAAAWYGALQSDSDPLVFIETIPNDQTRHFVHQVLADSWIYAREIGIQPASLDQLAEGNFPLLGLTTQAEAAN